VRAEDVARNLGAAGVERYVGETVGGDGAGGVGRDRALQRELARRCLVAIPSSETTLTRTTASRCVERSTGGHGQAQVACEPP
jgi:hypothetical protein